MSVKTRDPMMEDYTTPLFEFSKGSTQESSFAFIRAGLRSGIVDPLTPVLSNGGGVLAYWAREFGEELPLDIVESVALMNPRLGPVDNDGLPTLAQIVRNFMSQKSKYSSIFSKTDADFLAGILRNGVLTDLKALDRPRGLPFTGFFDLFKNIETPCWETLFKGMLDAGFDFSKHTDSLARFEHPSPINALLNLGLDVFSATSDGDPLWKVWSEKKIEKINQLLAPHLARDPLAEVANEKEKYFSAFYSIRSKRGRSSSQVFLADDLIKHLKSREDWQDLEDNQGRSAFFYLLLADPPSIRGLLKSVTLDERKRLLNHYDHAGRNVWFYVLGTSTNQTWTDKLTDELYALQPSVRDKAGRGVGMQWAVSVANQELPWVLPGEAKTASGFPIFKVSNRISWDFLSDFAWDLANDPEIQRQDTQKMIASFFKKNSVLLSDRLPRLPTNSMDPNVFNAIRLWCKAAQHPSSFFPSTPNPLGARFEHLFDGKSWEFPIPLAWFERSKQQLLQTLNDPKSNVSTHGRDVLLRVSESLHQGVRAFNLSRTLPSAQTAVSKPRF